ncbi:MAG: hypothetical protein ACLP9D_02605 [Candidatus Bathyarchaeia archaeon]
MAESSVIAKETILRAMKIFSRENGNAKTDVGFKLCPTCSVPVSESHPQGEIVTHNVETCRLVNLVLSELGVSVEQTIRVDIYPGAGPLRGFYFTADPYSIHISEEAYSQLREYIIFHETKHLVDCLTIGRSEEITPDHFARSLCIKYGYTCPIGEPATSWFAYA